MAGRERGHYLQKETKELRGKDLPLEIQNHQELSWELW